MKQLPNITSLRFFLALLVMIFHIPQFFHNRDLPYFNDLPFFTKGTEAVYMFFSLSGFLIIKQLFLEKEANNKIDLKKFYIRRALRILPLYYLISLIGLLYYNIFLPCIGIHLPKLYSIEECIVLLGFLLPNVLSLSSPGGILEILWSIGIEEQFYLFIAPSIALIPKRYFLPFLFFFSVIFVLLYHSPLLIFLMDYKLMFFYFTFGGLCSFFKIYNSRLSKLFSLVIYLFVIIYFTTGILIENLSYVQYDFFSMILFGIFINLFTQRKIIFFEHPSTVYLGKISYGIYMYHSVILQFVSYLFLNIFSGYNLSDVTTVICSYLMVIIITVFLSHLSYQLFEKRFLRKKSDYRVLPRPD